MRPAILFACAALSLASPAWAARDFRIGGQAFTQADILDARSVASAGGGPAVLVTLAQKAWPRLAALSKLSLGKPLNATLDGKTLTGPIVREAIGDGMIELMGFASFEESEKQAELISGKPPVPDSLED
jgi:preprotein translocase subunit SecD